MRPSFRPASVLLTTLVLVLAGCQHAPADAAATRAAGGVAAANPLAVEAGLEVLRRGGSAVDAAVAVQSVLGMMCGGIPTRR